MPRSFAAALDECLEALAQGATLEDCLARYPQYADELRVHLLLARRLAAVPGQQPRPVALAAGLQQFRARAQDLRMGRRPSLSLEVSWMRPLVIAAGLVLAVIVAGGGTVYAAQDARPDSPLYRVKLLSEDARVWFTFDDADKAELLLDQSNERTEEIMGMLRDGKEIPGNVLTVLRERNARAVRILEDRPDEIGLLTRAREQSAEQERLLLVLWGDLDNSAQDEYAEAVATLHNAQLRTTNTPGAVRPEDVAAGVIRIAGTAEQVDDETWLLGGLEVKLDHRAFGDTELEPGQAVNVVAARGTAGQLLALSVEAGAIDQAEPRYFVSGAVEDVSENEVTIAGQRIAITETTLLKLKLLRGQQVEVQVEEVDGQPVATSVDGETEEEPALTFLAYEGVIEDNVSTEGVSNEWLISGREVTVTRATEIDALSGILAEGARVRVEAVAEEGGVVARRVIVIPADAGADTVRVEGVLQETDEEGWTVSGVEMTPPPDTETPQKGSMVSVEARRSDDRLLAEKLLSSFVPLRGGFTLLRGSLGAIGEDGTWQVGLVPILISESTVVRGDPQVGSRVFIWAGRDDDGALEAAYVNVLPSAPPAPAVD